MNISGRLITLFDSINVPQHKRASKLAIIARVSHTAAANWLKGEVKSMRYDNLKAIADYFSITVEELAVDTEKSNRLNDKLKQVWTSLDDGQKEFALELLDSVMKAKISTGSSSKR